MWCSVTAPHLAFMSRRRRLLHNRALGGRSGVLMGPRGFSSTTLSKKETGAEKGEVHDGETGAAVPSAG